MHVKKLINTCFVILTFFILIKPAWGDDPLLKDDYLDKQSENLTINDPHEHFNRKIFSFNDKTITHVLRPIAKKYDAIFHRRIQKSIYNLYTNVRMPGRLFNSLFQGKFKSASIEIERFLINSTVGLGGFFDPAYAQFKLPLQDEDFGQTLGHYGMGSGSYFVFPIIGPTSRRDLIGMIGDAALDPLTWVGIFKIVQPTEAMYGINGFDKTNYFAYQGLDNYDDFIKGAIDPYIAVQHAYIQNRDKKIKK